MLGPVELWTDGRRHDLGSRKEKCLLAVLLWELGRPVPAETLVSQIWDDPSETALDSFYPIVSRLRRKLGDASGTDGEEWLPKRSGSYVLRASPHDIDVWRFRALRDQARDAAASGDDALAVTLYKAAEALWRGTPLDGLDCDWAARVRVRLNADLLAMSQERLWAGLRLGRYADLVGEIADLAAQDWFNEDAIELLMFALYGAGRRAEALTTYRDARHRYQEAFGTEPGPRLRSLHQRMLREDPTLCAMAPPRVAPYPDSVSGTVAPSTMPRDDPDFTGRATELRTLASWLGSDRAQSFVPAVVISGMAGVGKTTLAVHAAHQLRERYPNQMFIRLRAHHADEAPLKPAALLGSLLRRLGMPDTVIPADGEERAAMLRSTLAGRHVLIVLDDACDADQVLPLLPGTPGCLVLVTTRHRKLSLPGMLTIPLEPMPHTDAAAFFARTAGVSTAGAADWAAISRVVRLCGYVPQRIQLAGSQLRVHPAWSVDDLVARLRDTESGVAEMTATFDLSYRTLTPGQQRLFRRLALHPGDSFSVYAAAAMGGDASPAATRHTLEVLLDYHMVEEPVPGRYKYHDLIREYAVERAKATESKQDLRLATGRLLGFYLGLVDRADRVTHPFSRRMTVADMTDPGALPPLRTRRECREVLEAEKTSLLAIARYAAADGWPCHAGLLAHLLGEFLDTWGDWADAIDLHRRAVDAWRSLGNASAEAVALADLGFLLCRTGRHAEAADRARDALAVARAASDKAGEAVALDTVGVSLSLSAMYAQALACHDQALALWRDLGDRHGEADSISRSGMPAACLGRHSDALRRAQLALTAYRELGDLQGSANALNNLGGMQQDAGCYDAALVSYEQAKDAFLEIGDRQGEAISLSNIGDIRRISGSYHEAIRDYRAALDIFLDIGDRRSEAETLNGMAAAFAATGDQLTARDHYEKALALASELAERHAQATSHRGIGAVHLAMGRPLSAAIDYRTALQLSQEIADPVGEGRARYGLGCAVLDTDGVTAAREHWRAALAIFEETGSPEADSVRARLEAGAAGSAEPGTRSG